MIVVGNHFRISTIGTVRTIGKKRYLQIDAAYIPGLTNLKGFSHLQVLWWAHLADNPEDRDTLLVDELFRGGPEQLGIFATRSPARPNPIMISTINVTEIDLERGLIQTPFIDAEDGTPVLDIKPYFPMQRVKNPIVPAWCRHWPAWQEDSAGYDWRDAINFE